MSDGREFQAVGPATANSRSPNLGQIPLRYLVADRFEAGSKLLADLQRAEIWPII